MAKIKTGDPIDLMTLSKAEAKIGDVKTSMLNEVSFNEENLGTWMLMDGRSCVGTAYQTATGAANVPDMVTNGEFPRQAKSGRGLGSTEGDAIRNITGTFRDKTTYAPDFEASGAFVKRSGSNFGYTGHTSHNRQTTYVDFKASNQVPTATENRPKNIAFNFFIKVDY